MSNDRKEIGFADTIPVSDIPDPRPSWRDSGEEQLIGQVLGGRYEILMLMGRGAFGRVYKAQHVELGKSVAIKVLHSRYGNDPELAGRLRREARAASRIGHPGIVDVIDLGQTPGGQWYIAMEYLEGKDLGQILEEWGKNPQLPIPQAAGVVLQACQALAAAHREGIVHRDLKPENMFIIRNGVGEMVKIVDFGLAKHTFDQDKGLTQDGAFLGTPAYMAPEQVRGEQADQRADIFALGAILYELLAGRIPHQGRSAAEVMAAKCRAKPRLVSDLRPDVPVGLVRLLDETMAINPEDRVQTMEEFEQRLVRAMQTRPSSSRPTKSRKTKRTGRRKRPGDEVKPRHVFLAMILLAGIAWAYGKCMPGMQIHGQEPDPIPAVETSR